MPLTLSLQSLHADYTTTLACIGAATLLYICGKTTIAIYDYVRPTSLPKYLHDDAWALVTGASDGIGRGFAEELLDRGFNVILHGRNEEKLKKIADALRAKHASRSIDILVADATKTDHDFTALQKKLKSLPGKLTVLINNIGGIHARRTYQTLEKYTTEEVLDCINANATFATLITSALLSLLKENGPSLILNCGSLTTTFCPPYIAVYAGTKGYIQTWASSLRAENLGSPVEILTIAIGNTTSNTNTTHEAGVTLTARECARASLNKVGCGYDVVVPHYKYALSALPFWLLPAQMVKKSMAPILKARYDAEEKAELQRSKAS